MDKSNPLAICHSDEDNEDALSLSDLHIYGDQNIKVWVEDRSMSYDTEQDFEFSSEMMITSHDSSNPIVFCGKIIHVSSQNIEKFESKKKKQKCYKHTDTNVVRKVSVLASKTKSRWYLFMIGFGSSRFPKEMHINDLRKRRTSHQKKCNHYGDECDTRRRMRSRGFLKFFGWGGGGSGTKDDETLCKHHF